MHKYPKFNGTSHEVDDHTAHLECTFVASKYPNLVIAEWKKTQNGLPINNPPRFMQDIYWVESDMVLIKLTINQATHEDKGTYFCSLRYNSNIINGSEVVSGFGKIDLHIGKYVYM